MSLLKEHKVTSSNIMTARLPAFLRVYYFTKPSFLNKNLKNQTFFNSFQLFS